MASTPANPFPTSLENVKTSLLLATLHDLSTPHFLAPVIHTATALTRDRLVIVLFSRHFNVVSHSHLPAPPNYAEKQAISHTAASSWYAVQRLLTFVYVQATKTAQESNKVLMCVDVLLKGLNQDIAADFVKDINPEIVFRVSGDSIPTPLPPCIGLLRTSYLPSGDHIPESRFSEGSYPFANSDSHIHTPYGSDIQPELTPQPSGSPAAGLATPVASPPPADLFPFNKHNDHLTVPGPLPVTTKEAKKPPFYPVVALGGTFDHLHAGHKILLSMGAWIASQKLIVGVTDDALLTRKPHAHLLEPLAQRIADVTAFLNLFKPRLEYDVTPITDVYGPTGWDPNVQALVVSRETLSGAKEIATYRQAHSLPPLELFVIDVISATDQKLDHADTEWLRKMKLSSTFIRSWIAERDAQEGKEGEDVFGGV